MIELSKERIEQILHEETVKTEEMATILRSIYTRYVHLYETYFTDISALNQDTIAKLRKYHEETRSLTKYYYMDIPQDVCAGLNEFEDKFNAKLLGPDWHTFLFDAYEEFKKSGRCSGRKEKDLKAEFASQALASFYEAMDYVFRDGFGTGSETAKNVVSGLKGLLFGKSS